MMLQKASNNSYATLKTPSEITDEADIVGTHGERLFPNKGLSVKQISKSIFRSGLVSEIRTGKNAEEVHLINTAYLKRIVNAYAPIGIPIVIVLNVPYKKSDDNFGYGYHAVTITGYKTIPYATSEPKEKIAWRSESITKLFVHDDGWGPFARMDFGEKDNEIINNWSKKFKVAKPSKLTDIIIPVYHKIRISYDDVELIVGAFHRILWRVYKKILKKNINWDIKLNYSEKYKQDSKTFNNSLREHIHLKSMPKYIWIAQCYFGNLLVMDVLFDATDVAIGNFGLSIFFHNAEIRANLSLILDKYPNFANYFAHPSKLQFYEFFKSECKNKNFDK